MYELAARWCGSAPRALPALGGLAAVLVIGLVVAAGPAAATGGDHGGTHGDHAATHGDDAATHGDHGDGADHGDHAAGADHGDRGGGAKHGDHDDDAPDDHGVPTSDEPTTADHGEHEGQDSHADEAEEHTQHGSGESTVTDATKARVLGGFGAVNAAAVGGAFLLRRRDRGKGRRTREERGSRR